jgi:hypothetical protein
MEWLKGTFSTGKPHISWENLWFPLKSVDGGEILHQAGQKTWDSNETL